VAIRNRIPENVGVPTTTAFSRTRTPLKLIADTGEPFGAVALRDRDHEVRAGELAVVSNRGFGRRADSRLLADRSLRIAR